jgi:Holliday junction resolvasome RuvABC endonuclease subunit
MSILSLDVSAASTGWCWTEDGKTFVKGIIQTKPKFNRAERLVSFSEQLTKVLEEYHPDYIVQEDTFAGKNVKTLKILSEFAGISKFTCQKVLGINPVVVANTTVKSYFKTKTKETLFLFMCDIFELKDLTFKKDNDIVDAHAQLMYFADIVLEQHKYRFDKEYGYLYWEDYIE